MKMKLLSLACLIMSAAPAFAAQTEHFDIYMGNDKKVGQQIVEHGSDGLIKVHFSYKDNGRGPDLDEQIRLAPDGSMTAYDVKGASTYGAIVDEHFTRKAGQAEWHSTSEKGGIAATGTSMYVPLNSSMEPVSLSISVLAERKDGKLPLLPSGSLSQRKLVEVSVSSKGKTQKVQLLAQTGIGLTPNFVWATTGTHPHLFAFIVPGYFYLVDEAWADSRKELETRQKQAEAGLLADMAKQLQQPLTGLTVIRNARVFDSINAKLGPASDVYILRGKISAILPAGNAPITADQEIDAGGKVLLPGLFDMHGHVNRWEGGLNLAAGVTSTRDMGNNNAQLQHMIDETNAGQLLSPQIVPAGFLEGESPYSANSGFVIKDLEGAKKAIDWYAEHGYPQIKIYNSFPREILPETTAYAHSRGLRVSGHIPAFLRAQEAVEQGYDEIQHINQVMLNFLVSPTTDTRTLERFYLPAEKVADLDFDGKPVQDFIHLLQQHKTVIDSTLVTFDFLKQKDGDMAEPYAMIADHMPPDVKRNFFVGTMKIPDQATADRYAKSYAKMVEFVGRLYRAGIPLVAGTDAIAGFTLQSELELYVKTGITPAQALQIATLNGAKYAGTLNERGSITQGKLADLVLVDGDPTTNIADIRKVALVITRGKLIYPEKVYQALGIQAFVKDAPSLHALAATPSQNATAMEEAPALPGGGSVGRKE